jgi:citronellol/citronellal dehydrogenase
MKLKDKTVIITGSSRGIGREIALLFAREGANVVITGKTIQPHPKLEGTVYTVESEIKTLNANCIAIPLDVRDEQAVQIMAAKVVDLFGGIDILVNNASAISLTPTLSTPMKKFDLMFAVNVRGTFACSQACIPFLKEAANPHIINMAPPLNLDRKWFKDHLAYTMSKYGMSMCTLGMAEELKLFHIAVNSLWPRTTIATAATKNLFPPAIYRASRTPAIVANAALEIVLESSKLFTGEFVIDENYLRTKGETNFEQYAIDPSVEPQLDFFLAN